LIAETDLGPLLDLVVSRSRDLVNAGTATLVPAAAGPDEPAPPTPAASAGQAIRNALMFADSERRRRWQQALVDATSELLAPSHYRPLDVVTRFAAAAADGETAAICTSAGSAVGSRAGSVVGPTVSSADGLVVGPAEGSAVSAAAGSGLEILARHGSPDHLNADKVIEALRLGAPTFDDGRADALAGSRALLARAR
jgi:hypothetical protein